MARAMFNLNTKFYTRDDFIKFSFHVGALKIYVCAYICNT